MPSDLCLKSAKTVKRDNYVYFQSSASALSNMYKCDLFVNGIPYTSAEQAFQATKAMHANNNQLRDRIWETRNPYDQKKLGNMLKMNADWEERKDKIMEEILWNKFNQNESLKTELLSTGQCTLVEATRDPYWGCGSTITAAPSKNHSWKGANVTGRILDRIRSQLRTT